MGGKTGFTSQCLNTLVTYAQKNGQSLVSVILRVNGAGKAYNESKQILSYGFDNFSTVNYKRGNSSRSFYDIMGLTYLGHAAKLQSAVWKRSPVSDFSVSLTIPNTIDAKAFAHQVDQEGRTTNVTYEYEGTNVGEARGFFSSIYAPVQLAFEGDAAIP